LFFFFNTFLIGDLVVKDTQASYDVNSHDDDPMPRYDLIDSNRHGTRCAGEVAAEGNNSICAVGVAFDAGIGGKIAVCMQSLCL
jgi:furin